MNKINNEFKNPDKSFSPYCFWFLNGDFEKEHITAIAKNMENKKMSPRYLQDRGIKKNPFLSDGFFDTLKAFLKTRIFRWDFVTRAVVCTEKALWEKMSPLRLRFIGKKQKASSLNAFVP